MERHSNTKQRARYYTSIAEATDRQKEQSENVALLNIRIYIYIYIYIYMIFSISFLVSPHIPGDMDAYIHETHVSTIHYPRRSPNAYTEKLK